MRGLSPFLVFIGGSASYSVFIIKFFSINCLITVKAYFLLRFNVFIMVGMLVETSIMFRQKSAFMQELACHITK